MEILVDQKCIKKARQVQFYSHMLHGAGIFTYIWVIFRANVGKYSSTMEHMGLTSGHLVVSINGGTPK